MLYSTTIRFKTYTNSNESSKILPNLSEMIRNSTVSEKAVGFSPLWSDFHFHTGDGTLWKSSQLVQGYQMDEACCSEDCKSWELFITFWSLQSTYFLELYPLLCHYHPTPCIVHLYIFVHVTVRCNTSFTQLSVLPDFELLNGRERVLF